MGRGELGGREREVRGDVTEERERDRMEVYSGLQQRKERGGRIGEEGRSMFMRE